MKRLSEKVTDVAAQARMMEVRALAALTEPPARLIQRSAAVRVEAATALLKVWESIGQAVRGALDHALRLRSKVDSDVELLTRYMVELPDLDRSRMKQHAGQKEAEADAALGYAIGAVRLAELAVLDAIHAWRRAESDNG